MKIYKIKNFKDGWFIGNFKPTIFKTKDFEICYKKHKKNEKWPIHYHKIATEYNYLISGKMKIQNKTLKKGDIFVLYPSEVANPIFLEDCELIVVKTPSIKGDKYHVKL
jgi:quercetin dioxygenase-like cupin family protein